MEFDYFYNRDGDRFSYYMLPKIIVTDERFKNLSSDAKILYSCLLERTSLSFRNKWLDEENRVYIIFTVEEIMEILRRSNKTAVKILNELDSTTGGIGLIERKKRGLGMICTPFTGHPVEGVLLCGTHMSTKGNV